MNIVVSYAREDRVVAAELVQTLTSFGHRPWIDAWIVAGGQWWDEILQGIRSCDILLVVVSPALLASKTCELERRYATALRRHVFPVRVVPMSLQGVPADLVQIQMLDYTGRDAAAATALDEAIARIPPAGPLPWPLPAPPPPPLSYLTDIADRIDNLPADLNAQHEIVTELTTGLSSPDPEERRTVERLIRAYLQHPNRMLEPTERAAFALRSVDGPPRRYDGPPARPVRPPPPAVVDRLTTSAPQASGGTVFISYRRQDQGGLAGRLYDRLIARFGRDRVFMDVDSIELGLDFADVIDRSLAQCTAMLVVIGKHWLDATDDRGRIRLQNSGDYVRLEIETALARNIRVIPILVEGAVVPDGSELPPSMESLSRRNGMEMSSSRFDSDVERLVRTLERLLAR